MFIGGERIEYFVKEGNTLKQLRRGTLGTGVKDTYPVTQKVYDQNISKTVPYKDMTQSQSFNGNGTTSTFTLGFDVGTIDEIEVFVAGKRLRKTPLESFDLTKDLDSPEGDVTLNPEFTLSGSTLTLYRTPEEEENIVVVRRLGQTWTTPGTSLADAKNDIADFLRENTTELPK